MVIIWRRFCENLRICMKTIEYDRGIGLIAFTVHFNVNKHFQNMVFMMLTSHVFWPLESASHPSMLRMDAASGQATQQTKGFSTNSGLFVG